MIAGTLEIQLLADMARLRRDMDDAKRAVGSAMDSIERSAGAARAALSGLVGGFGIGELVKLTDQYTKFTAQLRLATTSTQEYAQAYGEVRRIAKDAQADLAAAGTLYARIANGTRELGLAQSKVADITETVTLALKVSGATSAESASAMLQLSQAFASGTLRGEEFNAVNEAAPRLMKALADGVGMPVGALKQMASDGKLTSSVLADALPRALAELRKEATAVQTISGAFTVLKNNALEFVGAQAQSSGAVSVVTRGIGVLADNLDVLTAAAVGFAATKLAELFAGIGFKLQAGVASTIEYVAAQNALRASTLAAAEARVAETAATVAQIAAMEAEVPAMRTELATKLAASGANIKAAETAIAAATATGALSGALRVRREAEQSLVAAVEARSASAAKLAILDQQQIRLNTQAAAAAEANAVAQQSLAVAQNASGTAVGLAGRALGLLGGPIGLITTLLGLGATAWMLWGSKSEQASQQAARAAENSLASVRESTEQIIANLDKQIEKYDLLLRAKNNATGVDNGKRYEAAYAQQEKLAQQLSALHAGTGEFARMSREEKLIESERIVSSIKKITDDITIAEQKRGAVETQTASERAAKLKDEMKLKGEALAARLKEIDVLAAQGVDEKTILDLRARAHETLGEKAKKVAAERADAADRLLKSIREEIAAEQLQIGGQEKLTKSQQLQIQLDADMRIGKDRSLQLRRAEILVQVQMLALLERESVARKEQKRVDDEHYGAVSSSIDQLDRQIATLQRENEVIGLTAAQTEAVEAARRADEIAIKRRALAQAESSDASASYVEALRIEIEQLQKVSDLKAQGARARAIDEETKKTAEEWRRVYDEIGQGLTDSFFRAFESGKNMGRTFLDGLKNLFKTTVLRIPFQYVQSGVMGALGLGGAGSAYGAVGGGGGGYGGMSNLSQVSNLLGDAYGVNGALGGMLVGNSVAYGAMVPGLTVGSQQAAMLAAQTGEFGFAGLGATASSAGYASGAGASMGSWVNGASGLWGAGAGIAGGMLGGALFNNKGYSSMGGSLGAVGGLAVAGSSAFAGTAMGAQLGSFAGPIGAIAGAVLGAALGSFIGGGGETRYGAGYNVNGAGKAIRGGGPSGGDPAADKVTSAIEGTYASLQSLSERYGGSLNGAGEFRAGWEVSPKKGRSFVFAGLDRENRVDLYGEKDAGKVLDALNLQLQRSIIQGLQRANLERPYQEYLAAFDVQKMRAEDVQAVLNTLEGLHQFADAVKKLPFKGFADLSATASLELAKVSGGMEALISGLNSYHQAYYSASEQQAFARKQLADQFAALNLAVPESKAAFRALMEGINLNDESGRRLYATLLGIAPAFAQITEAFDAFGKQVREFQASLDLGNLSTLTPEQQYAEAKKRYDDTSAAALGGDADAQGKWTQIAQAFLEASRAYYASGGQYAADYSSVRGFKPDGSHANGLAYVPFDGYRAELHEGERVLTRAENARLNQAPNWLEYGRGSSGALVAEIRASRAEEQALRAEVQALRNDIRKLIAARMQQAEENHQEAVAVADKGNRLLDELINEGKS